MDSNTLLEYALFQLTPTRTRCDFVVFSGSKKEKLASGLVEPFISHLKYAKEQLPKGGYSISLRPPPSDSSWFTKGTLERFVRFVSTPEVLERFVTIETEITQIESSVQVSNSDAAARTDEDADNNTNKSIVPYKLKVEVKGIDGGVQEENSKHRLQRVLETRKAVLRKEQAMAYFRAFFAGYEMECIDDLIAFADAFGASRLRDACISFKDLCYKKHNDGLWMDELAAMEAYVQPELPYSGTSGIVLATENINHNQSIMQNIKNGLPIGKLEPNGSGDASVSESATSSDVNQGQMPSTHPHPQYPMSWTNQHHQFMYNFPNQQMPPYQGYPFPGMQIPPQYHGDMQWPPNRGTYRDDIREPSQRRNHKLSSRKKGKTPNGKESQTSEQDELTESSDSTSEGELDKYLQHDQKNSSTEQLQKKKNGKKSSRMVVIRNINYITSKRKDGDKNGESDESSLDEDEFIDGDSIKQKVEDAVGSFEKHKSNSRHSKKRVGNKILTAANGSDNGINQDLENESFADISDRVQTNENWGAFQNLLLKSDDSGVKDIETQRAVDVRDEYLTIQSSESGQHFATNHAAEMESERGTKQRIVATDSFVVIERDEGSEGGNHLNNFEGENCGKNIKRRNYADEELLFSQGNNDASTDIQGTLSEYITESSLIKTQKGEDWYIINQPEKSMGPNVTKQRSIFDAENALSSGGDYFHAEKSKKNVFVDDSFMIQDRSFVDDQSDSQWRTDVSMVSDVAAASQHDCTIPDPSGDKCGIPGSYEPDDLYMVLDRSNSGMEPAAAWATEVDYGMDISFPEAAKQHSGINVNDCIADKSASDTIAETKSNADTDKKQPDKGTRSKPLRGSLGKSKTDIMTRNKKPSTISRVTMQRTKFETEEETRKRMEELLIERQKRIAERSTAKVSTAASKKVPIETKMARTVKDDKRTSLSAAQDTKKLSLQKSGITSSTVGRLASSTVPLKPIQSNKTSPKVNGSMVATLSPKTSKDENKKTKLNLAKSSKQLNGTPSPLSNLKDKSQTSEEDKLKIQVCVAQEARPLDSTDTSEDKEICKPPSTVAKMEQKSVVGGDAPVGKSFRESSMDISESSYPVSEHSIKLDSSPLENGKLIVKSSILDDKKRVDYAFRDNGVITKAKMDTTLPEPTKYLDSTVVNFGAENKRNQTSTEIFEEDIEPTLIESTPPSTTELSLDQVHSRKKWASVETTPSAVKGFKKLLLFGRKKTEVAV